MDPDVHDERYSGEPAILFAQVFEEGTPTGTLQDMLGWLLRQLDGLGSYRMDPPPDPLLLQHACTDMRRQPFQRRFDTSRVSKEHAPTVSVADVIRHAIERQDDSTTVSAVSLLLLVAFIEAWLPRTDDADMTERLSRVMFLTEQLTIGDLTGTRTERSNLPMGTTLLGTGANRDQLELLWLDLHRYGTVPWPTQPGRTATLGDLHATNFDEHPDAEQVAAMRAWKPNSSAHLPDQLKAGDVATIRQAMSHVAQTNGSTLQGEKVQSWMLSFATGLAYESVPFFIPPQLTPMLVAEPPGFISELKMPHQQMLVLFGQPLDVPPEVGATVAPVPVPMASITEEEDAGQQLTQSLFARTRIRVVGAILLADDNAKLRDTVGWLLAIDVKKADMDTIICVPGSLRHASAAGLIHNIVATIDIASWDTLPSLDLPDDHKSRRKALKKSATRKAMERGAGIDRLRIANLARTTKRTSTHHVDADTGRTVRPHPRRGHWRQVRCGPRDDWWYEGRFIGPTIVNADDNTTVDRSMRVLRVPPPRT